MMRYYFSAGFGMALIVASLGFIGQEIQEYLTPEPEPVVIKSGLRAERVPVRSIRMDLFAPGEELMGSFIRPVALSKNFDARIFIEKDFNDPPLTTKDRTELERRELMLKRPARTALSLPSRGAEYDCESGSICRPNYSMNSSVSVRSDNSQSNVVTSYYARRAFAGYEAQRPTYLTHLPRPTSREEIIEMVKHAADREGVSREFALSVAYLENGFKTHGVSHAGARGPLQVMPQTARLFDPSLTRAQMDDPRVNIALGMRYLKMGIVSSGSEHAAAARYEAGLGSGRVTSSYARKVDSLRKSQAVQYALIGRRYYSPLVAYAATAGGNDTASVYFLN